MLIYLNMHFGFQFHILWWFVNQGSDSPEISLIRTKSVGTDFCFWIDGRFSNTENLLIRKYRPGTNLSGLTNHHCMCCLHFISLYLSIRFFNIVQFLAHLSLRLMWAIVIAHPPSIRHSAWTFHIFNFFSRTAWWNLMKLGVDEVLMVPYKCCCFSARSTWRRIQGGAKIGHGKGPLLKKLFLQTWRIQQQTIWIAMI